jgi:hypothetical protein
LLTEVLAFAYASRSSGIDLEEILNEVGHFIQENTILPDDDTMRRSHRNSWKIAGLTFTWVDTAKTISMSTKLGKLFKRPATGKAPRDRRYR